MILRTLYTLTLLLGLIGNPSLAASPGSEQISPEMKESLIEAKRIIQLESEANPEIAKTHSNEFSLLDFAFAETAPYDCFYGGWPSQKVITDGRTYCQNPKKFPYYQNVFKENHCKENELACNPLIFGPEHCVDINDPKNRGSTYSRCEQIFQNKEKGSFSYLKPEQLPTLKKLFDLVEQICVSGNSHQKGGAMCESFLRKRKKIRELDWGKAPSSEMKIEKNQNCETCEISRKATNPLPQTIKEIAKNLKQDDVEETYKKIKDNYYSSGQCHRYSNLPLDDQKAFKIKLYKKEIDAFRPNDPSSAISESDAISTIVKETGMNSDESKELGESWAKLPIKGAANADSIRAEFQAKVISVFNQHLGEKSFESKIDSRAKELYQQLGLPDDCDPNQSDFVSLDAFKEAYAAKAKLQNKLDTKKSSLMTVLDRSLASNARRLMTIDLNSGKVLYHTMAGFGDGDSNEKTVQRTESPYCSNKSGGNASPFGYGITTSTRISSSFQGPGTFAKTGFAGSALSDRGIAFHSPINGNGDVFANYAPEEDESSHGELLKNALQNKTVKDVNLLLFKMIATKPSMGATNGCVAVSKETLPQLLKTIEGGSFVYFYCSPDQRK